MATLNVDVPIVRYSSIGSKVSITNDNIELGSLTYLRQVNKTLYVMTNGRGSAPVRMDQHFTALNPTMVNYENYCKFMDIVYNAVHGSLNTDTHSQQLNGDGETIVTDLDLEMAELDSKPCRVKNISPEVSKQDNAMVKNWIYTRSSNQSQHQSNSSLGLNTVGLYRLVDVLNNSIHHPSEFDDINLGGVCAHTFVNDEFKPSSSRVSARNKLVLHRRGGNVTVKNYWGSHLPEGWHCFIVYTLVKISAANLTFGCGDTHNTILHSGAGVTFREHCYVPMLIAVASKSKDLPEEVLKPLYHKMVLTGEELPNPRAIDTQLANLSGRVTYIGVCTRNQCFADSVRNVPLSGYFSSLITDEPKTVIEVSMNL